MWGLLKIHYSNVNLLKLNLQDYKESNSIVLSTIMSQTMRFSNTTFVLIIVLSCQILPGCSSQNLSTSSTSPSVVETIQTNRLEWIKSANDFTQDGLSSQQIDERISAIIQRAVDSNQLNANIETPINLQKLQFLNQVNPFTLTDLQNAVQDELGHYNRQLFVYKYGDFYISTQADTKTDQSNVYYTARALEILKTRYPEAYNRLFISSKQFLSNEPKYGQWLNRNKAFWIGFNTNPTGFSSNNHFFITGNKTPQGSSTSVNIAAINIHETKISGADLNAGSRPVYRRSTNDENYRLHMREGLIVSIVHEMLHNYIQYAAGVSDYYQKALTMRSQQHGFDVEEAVVVNTSYEYFRRKGGLMTEQEAYYYPGIFDVHMNILRNKNLLQNYARYYSTIVPSNTATNNNWRDVFILADIFD